MKNTKRGKRLLTRQIPRFTLVQISLSNGPGAEAAIKNLLWEVMSDEFFICWMEPEPWWQIKRLLCHYLSVITVLHCIHQTLSKSCVWSQKTKWETRQSLSKQGISWHTEHLIHKDENRFSWSFLLTTKGANLAQDWLRMWQYGITKLCREWSEARKEKGVCEMFLRKGLCWGKHNSLNSGFFCGFKEPWLAWQLVGWFHAFSCVVSHFFWGYFPH